MFIVTLVGVLIENLSGWFETN